jgi:acyl dehydratase
MPPEPAYFEDFRPGQRFAGGPRPVTAADLQAFAGVSGDRHKLHTDPAFAAAAGFAAPLLHGPFGIAAFLGWFYETGIARESLIAMLDSNWRYHAPIVVGDALSFEMTVTRCRRSSSGDKGVIGRHVRIRNQSGTLVQEGGTALLVRARGTEPKPAQEFFTKGWAVQLAQRLDASEMFRSATATWDGAFALACDDDEVQFRIFKGKVLEAGARSPNGPAFTLVADALTWTELFTAGSNELMQRAMQGQFSVRGSAYEYLRLTKALSALVDAAQELFHEGGAA